MTMCIYVIFPNHSPNHSAGVAQWLRHQKKVFNFATEQKIGLWSNRKWLGRSGLRRETHEEMYPSCIVLTVQASVAVL